EHHRARLGRRLEPTARHRAEASPLRPADGRRALLTGRHPPGAAGTGVCPGRVVRGWTGADAALVPGRGTAFALSLGGVPSARPGATEHAGATPIDPSPAHYPARTTGGRPREIGAGSRPALRQRRRPWHPPRPSRRRLPLR